MTRFSSLLFIAAIAVSPALAQTPAPLTPPAKPAKKPDALDQLAAKITATRTLVYKKAGDRELLLHILEPAGHKPTDTRACFITIHGGGWTGGNPQRMMPFADHYARQGLVGISIQYRLNNAKAGVTVYDCVKDARSAVRYVRAHAKELGIDPQKIIVSGGSAGGHLAAATALFDTVNEEGEDLSISTTPNALVLLFPVIDCSKEGYGQAKIGATWQELSPVHHVRAGLPPTITFHGTGDTVTPFIGAKNFHEAMLKAGNKSELVINEGGGHGYLMRDRALLDDTLARSDAFLAGLGLIAQP
ncbi:alpha/beta hydrolase [Prosthecobacter fusiformis]|nr:alpha/beta hydrolase [Prosthecobacter fusiformis]